MAAASQFQLKKGLTLPSEAVIVRSGEKVAFVNHNGVSRMFNVKTGIETEGWIKILDKSLPLNVEDVTMGQSLIDDGTSIMVVEIKTMFLSNASINELCAEIDNSGEIYPGYNFEFRGVYEALVESQKEMKEAGLIVIHPCLSSFDSNP